MTTAFCILLFVSYKFACYLGLLSHILLSFVLMEPGSCPELTHCEQPL